MQIYQWTPTWTVWGERRWVSGDLKMYVLNSVQDLNFRYIDSILLSEFKRIAFALFSLCTINGKAFGRSTVSNGKSKASTWEVLTISYERLPLKPFLNAFRLCIIGSDSLPTIHWQRLTVNCESFGSSLPVGDVEFAFWVALFSGH